MEQKFRSLFIVIGPAYWLLVALLYNGAYWHEFGINVLEFASLSDLIKMSVIPIVTSVSATVFGIILGTIPHYFEKPRKHWKAVAATASILLVVFLLGLSWGIALAVVLSLHFLITSGVTAENAIKDPNIRYMVVMILVFVLPFSAFFRGIINAEKIIDGREYSFVATTDIKEKYIGYVGEHFFFLSPKQSVIVRHKSSVASLELQQYSKYPKYEPLLEKWLIRTDEDAGDTPEEEADSPETEEET